MPLYEYTCRKCSKRFETLVFGKEKPSCPKCHGHDLEKLFSAFAVSGAERKSESDSFGDFGGGSDSGAPDFGGGSDFGGESDAGDSGFGGDSDPGDADLSGL
jgi:putative FmdB family regulatory protein